MTTITIDRALLEQTLQALVRTYHYGGVIAADAECITALRAALAQQAEPPGCDHCNHPLYAATKCRVCGRVTEQAEPVEPVAWRITDGEGDWDYRTELPEDWSIQWSARYGRKYEPLYTAPPQRKPLTDQEIDRATAQARDALLDHIYEYGTAAEGVLERVRKLCRAVERADGITGDPK